MVLTLSGARAAGPTRASAQARVPAVKQVADLRFGFAPMPAAFPGFDGVEDAKSLIAPGSPSPAKKAIPGRQYLGTFGPGSRYIIKVPNAWNRRLVVLGTPATCSEYANDLIWGEYLLAHGYAYACSNKGIPYNVIVSGITAQTPPDLSFPVPFNVADLVAEKTLFTFSCLTPHKVPIAYWNDDFALLAQTARNMLRPERTYAVGLSNGGAQVRWLVERRPDLIDGGLNWSAPYWSPDKNVLQYLPKFLAAMATYTKSGYKDETARAAIEAAGYPVDRFQDIPAHRSFYGDSYSAAPFVPDAALFLFAMLIDPEARSHWEAALCPPDFATPTKVEQTCTGATGLASPEGRAAYKLSAAGRGAIRAFEHTGRIGKPLISIAGNADMFITPQSNFLPYAEAVLRAGRASTHWSYLVDGGTHNDALAALGYDLKPQLPFAWAAFEQLVAVVERGVKPAGAGTIRSVTTPAEIS